MESTATSSEPLVYKLLHAAFFSASCDRRHEQVRTSYTSYNRCLSSPSVIHVDRERVREQLGRILASPFFRNSKRYPALLQFVVDAALAGRTDDLKERTLGVEVFNRPADYDTNADHIVRSTASDIRRKLAQYYSEPEHASELRIELLPGSYLPAFRPVVEPGETVQPSRPSIRKLSWRLLLLTPFVALILLGIWFTRFQALRNETPALDAFWQPVTSASGTAVLCVGNGTLETGATASATGYPASATLADVHMHALDRVPFSDSVALARIASQLGRAKKAFRVLLGSDTKLAELRQGPIVLVGAFDNAWTMRLTGPLRYTFSLAGNGDAQPDQSAITDQRQPTRNIGAVLWTQPYLDLKEDFAIISRVFDRTTGEPVVTIAGMTKFGTLAASEFVNDESRMKELARVAPSDWQNRNVQVVLAASVIRGSSGAPRILETYFW